MALNRTCMIARLTKDCELRYSNDGKMAIAKFSVACDRDFKKDGEPSADFYTCIAFGKTAEVIDKYAGTKGTQIALEGRFQNNNWEDKDGNKHYDFQFSVQSVTLLSSAKGGNGNSEKSAKSTDSSTFIEIPDGAEEELPFN